jgi:hypothetical protein
MSDFDKEAERERLREKYEREQEKRKSTEQMSELLLKGATMTNAHCNECGDPIFRYDGEEFCPTCQEVVGSADEAADDEEAGDAAADGAADAEKGDVAGASGTGPTESGADAGTDDGDAAGAGSTAGSADGTTADTGAVTEGRSTQTDANGADVPSADDGSDTPRRVDSAPEQRQSTRTEATRPPEPAPAREATPDPARSPQSPEPSGEVGDELGAARQSLTRTLLTQARQAERCDDPRRAKDHLAAAREAAEALSALSSY